MELTVADRIRVARRHARISQTQAAGAVGVHRGTFAHWERGGGHLPSSRNAIALAKLLKVNHEWLMTGRGDMICHDSPGPLHRQHAVVRCPDEQRWLAAFRRLPPSMRLQWIRKVEVFC